MAILEQIIIGLIFLMAIRYLFLVFSPKKETSGCSKGCGKSCVVSNFEENLKKLEQS